MALFHDREDAGRRLAAAPALAARAGREDVLVLGLPRGGVPVAFEVATALDAPLDIFVVRKLGLPGQEEYAMGAVASGGIVVLDEVALESLAVPRHEVQTVIETETREMLRRERAYRDGRPLPEIQGRCVVVVDDGLATGSTMRAAVRALAQHRPAEVVVAVPLGSSSACEALAREVDEVVCLFSPEPFRAVGAWYEDFSQTTDDEVRTLLARAAARPLIAHGGPR